jgi:hypothetical protein
MMERKIQQKQAKWGLLREDEKRKVAVEERRPSADEKRVMAEVIEEENNTMITWMPSQENGVSSRGWRYCKGGEKWRWLLQRQWHMHRKVVAVVALLRRAVVAAALMQRLDPSSIHITLIFWFADY